jgi:hypothetical protein
MTTEQSVPERLAIRVLRSADCALRSTDGELVASELSGVLSGLRRKTSQTRPNDFNNKQNQTLTQKTERLSLLAKARSSFPSFLRTWRIRQIPLKHYAK